MLEIALYQPDIAANAGTIARMCACFGLPLTIIEPAGFAWSDSSFRRAGMDYLASINIERAASWEAFQDSKQGKRRVLLSTKAATPLPDFEFREDDILLMGRESAGVPDHVHSACTAIRIPMVANMRSLNVAMATAVVTTAAMSQIGRFKALTLSNGSP
jgi:tRNA (cytidine/uridine-2'-O-)-methyltransferase